MKLSQKAAEISLIMFVFLILASVLILVAFNVGEKSTLKQPTDFIPQILQKQNDTLNNIDKSKKDINLLVSDREVLQRILDNQTQTLNMLYFLAAQIKELKATNVGK